MTAVHYSDLWQGIARADPERPAIVTADETLTYGRFAAEAGALSSHLTARGLRPGDAAAMLLYNRPEYLTFLWACLSIGVAPVAINYRYRAGEVRALLDDCDARALIVATSFGGVAAEAIIGLDAPLELISVDDGGAPVDGATPYARVVDAGGAMPSRAPAGADMRLYTGGTTGTPRAVVWDMDTLLHARRQSTWGIIDVEPPSDLAEAVAIAVDPSTPRVVTLPLPPLLHGTAQSTTMGTLALGGTIVLQASAHLDVEEAVRLARTHDVTRVIVAGDAVALPFVEALERDGVVLPRLNSVMSSGMRFSDEVKARLHRQGDIMIVDLLASSEGGPFAFGITRGEHDLPTSLVTTPDTVLLDPDLREVAPESGAVGILAFRGILPVGYYRDPVKTAATFPVIDGHRYVMPGDWARARGDGSIELLGRLSAVVNTGGEKVFPAEVEEALLSHPAVADAIVFGLPDPRFGEVVSAMVVPAPSATIDLTRLTGHVDGKLAGYKKPRHWFVRTSLGRSQTGKVELARVRADAAQELADRHTKESSP
ncbi:Long-chain-fatty-acid--CoA/3-oxocholest-4-en-26-oate--CoA ligase [Microbacterium lemovicicum]|uniref:Long-chain-fatty-acid--CoA/3-oxocholest-4-en-26-oate--CoA ligase n=1 Tax=Microbacterium lemovicicum TaxID=1072463 RepID=A0A3Q9J0D9_9MICO|nr:AMP-binding protein [Microbacterium lemovicicum]AZS38335.1 Long-chain-fatty-acid--CoA/3-oxocholest-4-en-26-oate--CoA ligase [Microbacterium lemovicicum]